MKRLRPIPHLLNKKAYPEALAFDISIFSTTDLFPHRRPKCPCGNIIFDSLP